MRLNKDKRIGRVLFIVEGSQTEFSILRYIFCHILQYSYIEKRRNKPHYFSSSRDRFSQVAVINTRESNIRDISENEDFLEELYEALLRDYDFPVDQAAIYYLFDRDPKSNTDSDLIEKYILSLADPYDNEDNYKAGQLLLSYPSVESYIISNFRQMDTVPRFQLGSEAKKYISRNTDIQINKMTDETLVRATQEFLKFLENEGLHLDMDHFSEASHAIFLQQNREYAAGKGFKAFSMLTLAFLQMGILEMDEGDN